MKQEKRRLNVSDVGVILRVTKELLLLNDFNVTVDVSVEAYDNQDCKMFSEVTSAVNPNATLSNTLVYVSEAEQFIAEVKACKERIISARRSNLESKLAELNDSAEKIRREMLKLEDSYRGKQAFWVDKNGVKQGTKVRVTRSFNPNEQMYWDSNSDYIATNGLVGMEGEVSRITMETIDVMISYNDGVGEELFCFPYFVLDIVKE